MLNLTVLRLQATYIYIYTCIFCGYPNHHPYFFWTVDTTNQATVEVVSPLKRSLLRFARHVASLKSRSLGLGISLYHWLSTTPYNTCFLTIANTLRVYNFPTSGSKSPHYFLTYWSSVHRLRKYSKLWQAFSLTEMPHAGIFSTIYSTPEVANFCR